ncbi:hypothetical protein ACGYJ8_18975 [Sulfitobacter sp. 1A12126]|uniref:hypothetical protein n=1 Tax=Sulfitobacter sp. 1A12126 TaxID=3368591 RepID=UPI003745A1F7
MVGISEHAWNVTKERMGTQVATAAFALVFEKYGTGGVASPGGWRGGMASGTVLNFVLWRGNCSKRRPTYEHRQKAIRPTDGRPVLWRPIRQGGHSCRVDQSIGRTRFNS